MSPCRGRRGALASRTVNQRRSSWVLGALALLLTVPATLGIARGDEGLTRVAAVVDGLPVTTLVLSEMLLRI